MGLEWTNGIHLAVSVDALLQVSAHDAVAIPEVNCAAVVGCRVCPCVACRQSVVLNSNQVLSSFWPDATGLCAHCRVEKVNPRCRQSVSTKRSQAANCMLPV